MNLEAFCERRRRKEEALYYMLKQLFITCVFVFSLFKSRAASGFLLGLFLLLSSLTIIRIILPPISFFYNGLKRLRAYVFFILLLLLLFLGETTSTVVCACVHILFLLLLLLLLLYSCCLLPVAVVVF
jgi:hypothetical protein